MTNERLEWHLGNWATYMQHDNARLGAKISSLYGSGGSSGADAFEIMCEVADKRSAQIIDACIDALKKPQQTAIYHEWLGNSFFWPTHDMHYEDAMHNILLFAEKRGLV